MYHQLILRGQCLVDCSRVELLTRLCGLLLAIYTVTAHIETHCYTCNPDNDPHTRTANVFLYGVRYGIRTRILRFLALRHDALTFRPNAHIWYSREDSNLQHLAPQASVSTNCTTGANKTGCCVLAGTRTHDTPPAGRPAKMAAEKLFAVIIPKLVRWAGFEPALYRF